jgi:hypothetical protein
MDRDLLDSLAKYKPEKRGYYDIEDDDELFDEEDGEGEDDFDPEEDDDEDYEGGKDDEDDSDYEDTTTRKETKKKKKKKKKRKKKKDEKMSPVKTKGKGKGSRRRGSTEGVYYGSKSRKNLQKDLIGEKNEPMHSDDALSYHSKRSKDMDYEDQSSKFITVRGGFTDKKSPFDQKKEPESIFAGKSSPFKGRFQQERSESAEREAAQMAMEVSAAAERDEQVDME